jgi:hypothetical protein
MCFPYTPQMLTAGNNLKEILHEELVATNNKNMFRDRALDHRDALDEEEDVHAWEEEDTGPAARSVRIVFRPQTVS